MDCSTHEGCRTVQRSVSVERGSASTLIWINAISRDASYTYTQRGRTMDADPHASAAESDRAVVARVNQVYTVYLDLLWGAEYYRRRCRQILRIARHLD